MASDKTHRLVNTPKMNLGQLAEYMCASDRKRRTIIRDCKYRPLARIVQHSDAKISISSAYANGIANKEHLLQEASRIRAKIADTDFEADENEHNADYIERFSSVVASVVLPPGELLAAGPALKLGTHGVDITADLAFRLRRVTRTNKIKVGASMLRYAKGKPTKPDVCIMQASLLFGILNLPGFLPESAAESDRGLCLVIDAFAGIAHVGAGDAVRKFANAEAACEMISNAWESIQPPTGAVF
ncbi:hypothetical protein [Pleomorphomonas sp. PLEO]|uniref:hypothetical protein n=1 Tax=Pleomorphomonas sp. PLEO TaxID=3239306 RepID=UPI00351EF408